MARKAEKTTKKTASSGESDVADRSWEVQNAIHLVKDFRII